MIKNCFLLPLILCGLLTEAQLKVGLLYQSPSSKDGYILFAPLYSKTTYLIDKCGKPVHSWRSKNIPGQSVYLLPDGKLLRTATDSIATFAGDGGKIEKLDWNSKVVWHYKLSTQKERRHHDVCPMPNGNILVLVWEKKTREEALIAGRDSSILTNDLWNEKILELKPVGTNSATIVWQWSVWDHLVQDRNPKGNNYGVVADNPQLININYPANAVADWLHFNSVSYNAKLNQIIISNRNFGELFIIDHSTSKIQAQSHSGGLQNKGGDLLYRWGNPESYNRGTAEDKQLFNQHSAEWIQERLPDAGKIIVFNNGLNRPGGNYSSVEIIASPVDKKGNYSLENKKPFLPDSPFWIYKDSIPGNFYSRNISGAQRLSNGNTLICEGANGKFFEIDANKTIVWIYVNPVSSTGLVKPGETTMQNHVFRCTFYEKNYAGFKDRVLLPGSPIELNPVNTPCQTSTPPGNKPH